MRIRLILAVAALAALAFAGLHQADRASAILHERGETASQLASQPAPDSAWPVLVTAAAVPTTTVQTLPDSGWRRHSRSTSGVLVVGRRAWIAPDGATSHRSFPLLI